MPLNLYAFADVPYSTVTGQQLIKAAKYDIGVFIDPEILDEDE